MHILLLRILGLTGTFIVTFSVLYAALVYRGKHGERFSLFSYFISELGEEGVSQGARVFNLSLIAAGLCLLPATVLLGFLLDSFFGWLGATAGIIASLGASAVGLFPVNRLEGHVRAALTFFRAGLVMLFAFGAAIVFQPADRLVLPRGLALLNAFGILTYLAFLILLTIRMRQKQADATLGIGPSGPRPRFRWLPTLEWLVFFSTLAWIGALSLFINPTP
ncbi:MAG: DUF998 domain-containing protein [Anaerolineales bacterium]|nr:DUF998 domain-containing protein [Anaerolineales bacterium]MDW8227539.1 DUF998 domain-containing protein [Anaerolineales bacterium]